MKFIKISTLILTCCFIISATAQQKQYDLKLKHTETINQELQFTSQNIENILVVNNVFGGVQVEGYTGKTIQIEVTKTIFADTNEDLEKGKKEIGIKDAQKDNAIYVYVDSPYSHFDLETGSFEHHQYNWNRNRNYKHRSKRMYKYTLDFKIKVPRETSIDLQAVNYGNISVENIQAKLLIVNNVNGAIDMKNVSGKTDVNALNKDINITYAENPKEESFYRSLNGDINIKFKEGLDAMISYKTMNGKFYTNFEVEKTVPKIKKTSEIENKGTKFRIDSNSHFKIGNGNVALHFDQLNGDAIVKK